MKKANAWGAANKPRRAPAVEPPLAETAAFGMEDKPNPKYEIEVHDKWHETSKNVFRSWGGKRRLDGKEYKGPVFYWLSHGKAPMKENERTPLEYNQWFKRFMEKFRKEHPFSTAPRDHVLSVFYDKYVDGFRKTETNRLTEVAEQLCSSCSHAMSKHNRQTGKCSWCNCTQGSWRMSESAMSTMAQIEMAWNEEKPTERVKLMQTAKIVPIRIAAAKNSDWSELPIDIQDKLLKSMNYDIREKIKPVLKEHCGHCPEDQLKVGIEVELEHTQDLNKAAKIAHDHLSEDPLYYSKLMGAGLIDEPHAIKIAKKIGLQVIKENWGGGRPAHGDHCYMCQGEENEGKVGELRAFKLKKPDGSWSQGDVVDVCRNCYDRLHLGTKLKERGMGPSPVSSTLDTELQVPNRFQRNESGRRSVSSNDVDPSSGDFVPLQNEILDMMRMLVFKGKLSPIAATKITIDLKNAKSIKDLKKYLEMLQSMSEVIAGIDEPPKLAELVDDAEEISKIEKLKKEIEKLQKIPTNDAYGVHKKIDGMKKEIAQIEKQLYSEIGQEDEMKTLSEMIDESDIELRGNIKYDSSDKSFSCFASDVTEFRDRIPTYFKLRNPKTGGHSEFNFVKTERDDEGDVQFHLFKSKDGQYQFKIFNT
jgi:Protein of unknown function (DUF5661)